MYIHVYERSHVHRTMYIINSQCSKYSHASTMSKFSSIHRAVFGLLLAVAVYSRTCESCTIETCPTWFYRHANDDPCICGASIGTTVFCNNETQEITVLGSHCLTSINWHDDCITTVVVGRCIFALNHGKKVYWRLRQSEPEHIRTRPSDL